MSTWEEKDYSGVETYIKAKLTELKARVEKYRIIPPEEQYLTIEATVDDTQLSWLFPSGFDASHKKTIQYSTDNGQTWNSVTADVEDYGNIGTINAGDKVLLRGNGATGFYDEQNETEAGNFLHCDAPCYVYGNAMSLLYAADFATQTEVPQYALTRLFSDSTGHDGGDWVLSKNGCPLVLPATTLASNCYAYMFAHCTSLTATLTLPATTLADHCCYAMFWGCTSLAAAPALPTTTLARGCYVSMFRNCTSLTSAPTLPATTLADSCYDSMFRGCTSLTSAPTLPATTLASNCYSEMFRDCTSLTTAPVLPATALANNCYNQMFYGCTGLTSAPELPVTTLKSNCYQSMFYGCTSLTAAPELPATTLTEYCYFQMFSGCTSLTSVTCLATNKSASQALYYWLNNVSATGTFTKAAGATWPSGESGIPSGWTVQTASE